MKMKIVILPILMLALISCQEQEGQVVEKTGDIDTAMSSFETATGAAVVSPPSQSQPAVKQDGRTITVGSISFQIDPSWVAQEPSSSMRLAQFSLPSTDETTDDAELVLFHGIGGTAEMNIERWKQQFQPVEDGSLDPVVTKKEVGPYQIQVLEITGGYLTAMTPMQGGQTVMPNYTMLAAMVEGPGGPVHFKLTGPEPTVEHWKDEYMAMLDTLEPAS